MATELSPVAQLILDSIAEDILTFKRITGNYADKNLSVHNYRSSIQRVLLERALVVDCLPVIIAIADNTLNPGQAKQACKDLLDVVNVDVEISPIGH